MACLFEGRKIPSSNRAMQWQSGPYGGEWERAVGAVARTRPGMGSSGCCGCKEWVGDEDKPFLRLLGLVGGCKREVCSVVRRGSCNENVPFRT